MVTRLISHEPDQVIYASESFASHYQTDYFNDAHNDGGRVEVLSHNPGTYLPAPLNVGQFLSV